ncbi:hypothetical protein L228DRAFT_284146 [Xylona heveae TC161]|uniref:Uncharacterized protein n=1 Tax=Xylona heveae (strain CBS 132557 / TC161) TaxID=1328760 RepID=A0A165FK71_XYLHT|nr:hypothetical protein L228DRAFT_284146 [Xylona heveae TC161]KZF21074.1 hypothetical protein L228DRAFT_284146 [Xylona heveae TC161]
MAPNAIPASQTPALQWTSLPITKFSHAINLNQHDTNVNWSHITKRDNMFVVFDSAKSFINTVTEERRLLKVIVGADVVEIVDLDRLCQDMADAAAQSSLFLSQTGQTPSAVMIRCPCIAMRYLKPTGEIRRFQIRLAVEADFYTAASILTRIGFSLNNGPVRRTTTIMPPSRPISAPSQLHPTEFLSLSQSEPAFDRTIEVESPTAEMPRNLISSIPTSHRFLDDQPFQSSAPVHASTRQLPEDIIRPTTAPVSMPLSQEETLTQIIPPRRELPFGRPVPASSSPSRTTIPKSGQLSRRPTFSVADLPPLRTPTYVSETSDVSNNTTLANTPILPTAPGETTKTRAPRKRARTSKCTTKPNKVTAPLEVSQPSVSEPPVPHLQPSSLDHPTTSVVDPNSACHYQPLSDHASNQAADSSSQLQPPLPSSGGANEPLSSEYLAHIDAFIAQHAPNTTASSHAESLVDYSSLPNDERLAALDTMICNLIEDENFITLCQDVENTWRRIGLQL